MAKTSAILLSIALTLSSSASAFAQNREQDSLDAIYDQINAQARAGASAPLPVRDSRAFNQFMQQTSGNLNVEYANTAKSEAARRQDAMTTGSYEQKRINELADWEKSQIQNSTTHYGRSGRTSTRSYNTGSSADLQAVEANRRLNLSQSDDSTASRLQDNAAFAQGRDQAMQDVANNLRDQVLSTQSSDKPFGLQGVGTNLYVRQYGRPDANLPPVRNAAARIVPSNSDY